MFAAAVAIVPSAVAAQELIAANTSNLGATIAAFAQPTSFVQPAAIDVRQPDFQAPVAPMSGRSRLFSSLLVSTVVMQALDVHSTYRALGQGAVEANPLMAGVTSNRGAFLATKAAVATATVLAARHMAKRNKVAAIATLIAINSAYVVVVDHNYRVARGLR